MPAPDLDPQPAEVHAADDAMLATRAALGDRDAFALIFRRHAPGMFRYALRMLDGDDAAAEDAVQEAWAQAWVHLPQFRFESSLHTWLFRITASQVLGARRRRRPVPVDDHLLHAAVGPDRHGPATHLQHAQLREALDLALGELPWRQRASWLLREIEGLSYEEIAKILQTSPTVVRGQLHRARRTLAVRMSQWR